MEWKRYATSDQNRHALEEILKLLKAHEITKILGHDSCLETISSGGQTWIIENWLPRARAAGLKAIASKKSGSFFTRRAVNIIHTAAAEAVETKVFVEFDDARTWLRRA